MGNLYYIYLNEDDTGFHRLEDIDFSDCQDYRYDVYHSVIKKHFEEQEAIIRLSTGKFNTKVFIHKDKSIDIAFCLLTETNYPADVIPPSIDEEQKKAIRKFLNSKVSISEGVLPENRIDIMSQFVTTSCRFSYAPKKIQYFNLNLFDKDTIILGPPGSGKTTILRMIAIKKLNNYLEKDGKLDSLPIYIQLRKFNDSNSNFETFLNNSVYNSFIKSKLPSNEKFFSSGKLLLLLDGADEIDFEKFNSFASTIDEYKAKFPLVSFIISSRSDRSFEKLSSFVKCYVEPFDDNQIRELTFKKLSRSNKWKSFLDILNSAPEIRDILRNPLLLSISHFLFSRKAILPINTGQLLKELVEVLINSWDVQRKIDRKLNNESVNPNEIINVLGKLSLILTEKKTSKVKIKEISDAFKQFSSQVRFGEFLKYIEFSTSIINVNRGFVEFSHKSLQDYFCSNYLVESVREIDRSIFVDQDWDKILSMISGISSDPNYLINEMISISELNDELKIKKGLSMFSESSNLSKEELKNCFTILEKFILDFEHSNEIKAQKKDHKAVFLNLSESVIGFSGLVNLLKAILKIRFTKYEYDFNGYLKKSNSSILRSIEPINTRDNKVTIRSGEEGLIIEKQVE